MQLHTNNGTVWSQKLHCFVVYNKNNENWQTEIDIENNVGWENNLGENNVDWENNLIAFIYKEHKPFCLGKVIANHFALGKGLLWESKSGK